MDRKTNEFYTAGTHIYPSSSLCKFYRTLANTGGEDFYNGTLSKLILDDLKELGSIIDAEDLRTMNVKWTDTKRIKIDDNVLLATPPPTSGFLVAFILNVLKGFKFTPKSISNDTESLITYHRIVETFKYAYSKRMDLADPDFENINDVINDLISAEYAESIRKSISTSQTYSSKYIPNT